MSVCGVNEWAFDKPRGLPYIYIMDNPAISILAKLSDDEKLALVQCYYGTVTTKDVIVNNLVGWLYIRMWTRVNAL